MRGFVNFKGCKFTILCRYNEGIKWRVFEIPMLIERSKIYVVVRFLVIRIIIVWSIVDDIASPIGLLLIRLHLHLILIETP